MGVTTVFRTPSMVFLIKTGGLFRIDDKYYGLQILIYRAGDRQIMPNTVGAAIGCPKTLEPQKQGIYRVKRIVFQ